MFDVCVCAKGAKGSFLEPLKTDDTEGDPGEGVDFPAPFFVETHGDDSGSHMA